jgi:hypothetical protein
MLFYRAALPLSRSTLDYLAGVVRRHRRKIGSCWRKLNPGQQALLVLVHLHLFLAVVLNWWSCQAVRACLLPRAGDHSYAHPSDTARGSAMRALLTRVCRGSGSGWCGPLCRGRVMPEDEWPVSDAVTAGAL